MECSFTVNGQSGKVATDVYAEKSGRWQWSKRTVCGINSGYSFVAIQTTKDGPYFTQECGADAATRQHVRLKALAAGLRSAALPLAVNLDGRSLPELVASKGFELVACRDETEKGRDLVEAEFSFKPAGEDLVGGTGVRKCVVLLDPAADWHVVKCTTKAARMDTNQGEMVSTTELTYAGGKGETETLSSVTSTFGTAMGTTTGKTDFTFLSHDATPQAEFFLPSFGLPDCYGVTAIRWRRLVIIGINCIILGFILYLIYRRLARTKRTAQ